MQQKTPRSSHEGGGKPKRCSNLGGKTKVLYGSNLEVANVSNVAEVK